jgi:hypothetical protein
MSPVSVPAPGILGNDSDPDGDALVGAVVVTGPLYGVLAFDGSGRFFCTPTPRLFTGRAALSWTDPLD